MEKSLSAPGKLAQQGKMFIGLSYPSLLCAGGRLKKNWDRKALINASLKLLIPVKTFVV